MILVHKMIKSMEAASLKMWFFAQVKEGKKVKRKRWWPTNNKQQTTNMFVADDGKNRFKPSIKQSVGQISLFTTVAVRVTQTGSSDYFDHFE